MSNVLFNRWMVKAIGALDQLAPIHWRFGSWWAWSRSCRSTRRRTTAHRLSCLGCCLTSICHLLKNRLQHWRVHLGHSKPGHHTTLSIAFWLQSKDLILGVGQSILWFWFSKHENQLKKCLVLNNKIQKNNQKENQKTNQKSSPQKLKLSLVFSWSNHLWFSCFELGYLHRRQPFTKLQEMVTFSKVAGNGNLFQSCRDLFH